ncbi:hypothetical protein DACRYDRAFT_108486 [Dacryopinax primogenitus]|uniref:Protein kinase domain-containing protein n=1 Tax=Dacryopinax primogenitus (strain DJM 731) TaxID=1858805 RepID=M5FZ49_DACPD|nr:uncharacterized protein DACRYDRAFT_108486 [Dacryopinax primogenitus]EJU01155.1 hypothetical protein DACRYDRAFT_108486 [Dacryopinax primogenitus]
MSLGMEERYKLLWLEIKNCLPEYRLDFSQFELQVGTPGYPVSGKVIRAVRKLTNEDVHIRCIPLPQCDMELAGITLLTQEYDRDCLIVRPIELKKFTCIFENQPAAGVCYIMPTIKPHWRNDLTVEEEYPLYPLTAGMLVQTVSRVLQIGRQLEAAQVVHNDIRRDNFVGEGDGLVLIDLELGRHGPDEDHRPDDHPSHSYAPLQPFMQQHFPMLPALIRQLQTNEITAQCTWNSWHERKDLVADSIELSYPPPARIYVKCYSDDHVAETL